jgi:phosphoglycerate dehydrogenase-like enzyme
MLTVAFAGTFAARFAPRVRQVLAVSCETILGDDRLILSRLPHVDVLVTLAFTEEMARAAARLKLVQVPGIGLDRIDRGAIRRGTWLANAYGHEVGIAEHVMGALLLVTRDFCRLDAALRRGEWHSPWVPAASTPVPWPELAGKTLGILGFGRIGQAVAKRAHGFGMTIRAMGRRPGQPAVDAAVLLGGPEALEEILAQSDYLVVALSLTPATRALLGDRELRLMKPTAYLVNVARAEILDEDALYRALAERVIGGAALDVWYRYPTADAPTFPGHRPFHDLPNVLLTPHISAWTSGMLEARAKLIAENIERVARGLVPVNLVM